MYIVHLHCHKQRNLGESSDAKLQNCHTLGIKTQVSWYFCVSALCCETLCDAVDVHLQHLVVGLCLLTVGLYRRHSSEQRYIEIGSVDIINFRFLKRLPIRSNLTFKAILTRHDVSMGE